jgi:hypothetical protein
VRSLSAGVDRPVTDYVICDIKGVGGQQAPIWSGGDRELFVPLCSEGACAIAAFARDGSGHRLAASGERDIYAFSRADDGTLAFGYSTPTVPSEIALLDPYGNEERLTDCNPWLAERIVRAPRRVRPAAADGTVLDLFLLDPEPAAGAPWVLQVHGGPHTAYGFAFCFEFHMLASHGIGVAYGNPRGSQSYGHAYADAITGDWGGLDAADVLALLDGAQANATIDPARVGLAGGSYGGFMTTWLLGHSERFACGVSMRAVNDLVSEVGAADLGWFLENEVGAPLRDVADARRAKDRGAAAGRAFRARLSLPDRSGRATLHAAQPLAQRAGGVRALHRRRTQPLAHGQAAQSRVASARDRALVRASPASGGRGTGSRRGGCAVRTAAHGERTGRAVGVSCPCPGTG